MGHLVSHEHDQIKTGLTWGRKFYIYGSLPKTPELKTW